MKEETVVKVRREWNDMKYNFWKVPIEKMMSISKESIVKYCINKVPGTPLALL